MGNKIGIIYFSGTGNTKFVAQNIAKKLQQWGEELDLINIEKDKIIPTHYKYLIIGGPIYIDRYPEILIKYASRSSLKIFSIFPLIEINFSRKISISTSAFDLLASFKFNFSNI